MAANKQSPRWAELAGASSLARHFRMSTPSVQLMHTPTGGQVQLSGRVAAAAVVGRWSNLGRSLVHAWLRPAGRHWLAAVGWLYGVWLGWTALIPAVSTYTIMEVQCPSAALSPTLRPFSPPALNPTNEHCTREDLTR
jgi:hypothetical protein